MTRTRTKIKMKTQLKIVVKAEVKNNSEYDFMISYQTCIIDFLGHCSVVSVILAALSRVELRSLACRECLIWSWCDFIRSACVTHDI